MPLPSVSDRIKELPGQALRTMFAGIGQLLLAADKARAQIMGSVDAPAQRPARDAGRPAQGGERPAQEAVSPAVSGTRPAGPARARRPAAARQTPDRGDVRWRSLDKTGNVRLLSDGDGELADAAHPAPAAVAEPAPAPAGAEHTGAEPAVPEAAELTVPEPGQLAEREPATVAEPGPAQLAVPEPAELAEPTPAVVAEPTPAVVAEPEPAEPAHAAAAPEALPVPGYDQLSVASLRARLRVLDTAQLRTLLGYEQAHQNRADVITMFERRIAKLEAGG